MKRVSFGVTGLVFLLSGIALITALIMIENARRSAPPATSSAPPATSSALLCPPSASAEVPSALKLLAKGVTEYKTDAKDARVHNIRLGASKLNEKVMEPGKVWSFNETVGRRTEETGFRKAPTLVMGEVIQDVGGGMCQVSTTTFIAVLEIAIDVVKRHAHSRPSSYAGFGKDATVNYPKQCWEGKQDPNVCFDLRVKNPYDFPITIRTRTEALDAAKMEMLVVELWGKGPVAKVESKWTFYGWTEPERKWRRGWKPGTWTKKKQSSSKGVNGALAIDVVWPDGRKDHRVMVSRYKPVDEIWYVGRDWEGGDPW